MNNTTQMGLSFDKEVKDLVKIEQNINSAIKEFQNTKKRLCLLLAQIKINKLYEQIDLKIFQGLCDIKTA